MRDSARQLHFALLVLCLHLFMQTNAFAANRVCVSATQKNCETVILAMGLAMPPYVFSDRNAGMEYDIIAQALAREGYWLKPLYVPNGRVPWALNTGKADAAAPVNESSGVQSAFFSESHITYQNVVVTLQKNHYVIKTVSDLTQRDMVAFQNASKYLGQAYKTMANNNPRYHALARQDQQVEWLYRGSTEAIVIDINIFQYYRQRLKADLRSQPVEIHAIFPASPYKVAFRRKEVRDKFDSGLSSLKRDGSYDKIIKKYIQP